VNVDAVLLAWFAGEPRRVKRAVDLGAGVGAVGLSLLLRDRASEVVFVEIDPVLSALGEQNLAANGWADRGVCLTADVSRPLDATVGSFDLVVCNPPYVEAGRGRPRRVAEGARVGELAGFVQAARRALGPRGRACFVYPAPELGTLLATLRSSALEPKRMRFVHASADQPARVILVEALPAKPGGLVVLPPLVERDARGPSEPLRLLVGG
jgi:tRNA1Val (adenine37-N6)-methyltransferase